MIMMEQNTKTDQSYLTDEIIRELGLNFKDRVSFVMLKSHEDRDRYVRFARSQGSFFSLLFGLVLSLVFLVAALACALHFDLKHVELVDLIIVSSVIIFIVLCIGSTIIWIKTHQSDSEITQVVSDWLARLQNAYSIGSSLVIGIILFICSSHNDCALYKQYCSVESHVNALPQDILIIALSIPIISTCVFRKMSFPAILLSWLIIIISIILSIVITNKYYSFGSLIIYIPFSALMMYELQRQSISTFFLTEQLFKMVHIAEEQTEEFSREYRHLMGNLTHDLKTPIAGIMGGLECIESVNKDMIKEYHKHKAHMVQIFQAALHQSTGGNNNNEIKEAYISNNIYHNIQGNTSRPNSINSNNNGRKMSQNKSLEQILDEGENASITTNALPPNTVSPSTSTAVLSTMMRQRSDSQLSLTSPLMATIAPTTTITTTTTTTDNTNNTITHTRSRQNSATNTTNNYTNSGGGSGGYQMANHIQKISLEDYYQNLEYIQLVINNIKSINNFMTMTINRCIDYTKVSKGIKLSPKNETIFLQDVLELPINCVRGLQSRIAVILKPVSIQICPHIITDKQWLQENLLCLLSNAVKYSQEGEVKIQITMENKKRLLGRTRSQYLEFDSTKSSEATTYGHVGTITSPGTSGVTPIVFSDKVRPDDMNDSPENSHKSGYTSDGLISTSVFEKHKVTLDMSEMSPNRQVFAQHFSMRKVVPLEAIHDEKSTFRFSKHATAGDTLYLLFEVIDTGIGLSKDKIDTLFTPFKQAQRYAGGTGLGLFSLAKRVEALDGYYGVKNRADGIQGSVFWFAIPYKPDEQTAKYYSAKCTQSRRHMILVDDDSDDDDDSDEDENEDNHDMQIRQHNAITQQHQEQKIDEVIQDMYESSSPRKHSPSKQNETLTSSLPPVSTSTPSASASSSMYPLSRVLMMIKRHSFTGHTSTVTPLIQSSKDDDHDVSSSLPKSSTFASKISMSNIIGSYDSYSDMEDVTKRSKLHTDIDKHRLASHTIPCIDSSHKTTSSPSNSILIPSVIHTSPSVTVSHTPLLDHGINKLEGAKFFLLSPRTSIAASMKTSLHSQATDSTICTQVTNPHHSQHIQSFHSVSSIRSNVQKFTEALKSNNHDHLQSKISPNTSYDSIHQTQHINGVSRKSVTIELDNNIIMPLEEYTSNSNTSASSGKSSQQRSGSITPQVYKIEPTTTYGRINMLSNTNNISSNTQQESHSIDTHHDMRLEPIVRSDSQYIPSDKVFSPSQRHINNQNINVESMSSIPILSPSTSIQMHTASYDSTQLTSIKAKKKKQMLSPSNSSAQMSNDMSAIIPLRILLVDDAVSILKMVTMMLKKSGYTVDNSIHGSDALQKLKEAYMNPDKRYDVVLMDIQMPVMDGLECTRRYREFEAENNTKIDESRINTVPTNSILKVKSGEPRSLLTSSTDTTGTCTSPTANIDNESEKITSQNNHIKNDTSSISFKKYDLIIIGCSANSDDETYIEAMKSGMNAFIVKPLTLKAFKSTYSKLKKSKS